MTYERHVECERKSLTTGFTVSFWLSHAVRNMATGTQGSHVRTQGRVSPWSRGVVPKEADTNDVQHAPFRRQWPNGTLQARSPSAPALPRHRCRSLGIDLAQQASFGRVALGCTPTRHRFRQQAPRVATSRTGSSVHLGGRDRPTVRDGYQPRAESNMPTDFRWSLGESSLV